MKSIYDTERLDWLAENFHAHSFRYHRGYASMDNSHPPKWIFWSPNEGTTSRPTIREAIDEAMRKSEPRQEDET